MRASPKTSRREQIVALAKQGATQVDICKQLDLSKGYVSLVLAAAGVMATPAPRLGHKKSSGV